MQKSDLAKYSLPDEPGVYIFKRTSEVVYVGKATSLRERVKSYFGNDLLTTRGGKVAAMVLGATNLEWEETDSVLEALILEANLIKKYIPVGNTREKDNKSFNYVVVTEEDFPRILIVRGRELFAGKVRVGKIMLGTSDMREVFGPYPDGTSLREALKLVRKIFPFRDACEVANSDRLSLAKLRPCFNRQIYLCPGVCDGTCSKKDYAQLVRNVTYFFMGKKKELVRKLEKEMKVASRGEEFEVARTIQRQLKALAHIRDIALIKREDAVYKESAGGDFTALKGGRFRIEAYDVAHISGTNTVGVMVVSEEENGKMQTQKAELRKFIIRTSGNNDLASLAELLIRRFKHPEWRYPNLVVIDGGETHIAHARGILFKLGMSTIPVVSVVKDDKHKARGVIGDDVLVARYSNDAITLNIEAHTQAVTFHRARRDKLV
jgi:excinuclease UvrABC nuclease subunit